MEAASPVSLKRGAFRAVERFLKRTARSAASSTQQNIDVPRRPDALPSYEQSCLQSLDYTETQGNIQREVHPVLMAAWRNRQTSLLLRLPDAVLVTIMQQADLDDLLRLRHVCRDFMRLFGVSQAFHHLHLANSSSSSSMDESTRLALSRIWATPAHAYPGQKLRSVHRQSLCRHCTKIRQKANNSDAELLRQVPFLYCSGCKMEHRAYHFTPEQRYGSEDKYRLCINRKSLIRLCEHVSVTWESAQRLADGPPSEQRITCDHVQHQWGADPLSPHQKWFWKCNGHDRPYIQIWRREDGSLNFDLSLMIHVPFVPNRPGKLGMRAMDFTENALNLFKGRYPGHSASWSMLNRAAEQDAVVKPFDPNVCSCLNWGLDTLRDNTQSYENLNWKLTTIPNKAWRSWPKIRPGLNYYTTKGEREYGIENRCAGFAHSYHATPEESWRMNALTYYNCECRTEVRGEHLVLRETLASRVEAACDADWARAVDRSKMDTDEDEEMRGICWCPNDECRRAQVALAAAMPAELQHRKIMT